MKDKDKTKEQLINELVEMRQRVAELERAETEHKQEEEELRETNIFLSNILDSSSFISIISTDLERNVLFWNKGAENIFGYKAEEIIGHHKIDILYPDDEGDTKESVEEVRSFILKSQKGISCEIREVTKDGRKIWISLTSTPRFDENGNVIGILGIGEDITERKRTEELLQKERETFFSILQKAPYGVVLIDKDGKYLYINPEFTVITGYTLEDVPTGREWFHKAYPDPKYRRRVIETWKSDFAQRGVDRIFSVVCKDGEVREIELRPTLLDDGRTIVMLSDITERKRAEDELRRQALIFENMHDGIIVTDLESRIIDWNPAAERMFGYIKDEVLGKTTGVLTTRIVDGTLRDGRWSGEINFIRKDGTEGVCESIVVPLRDERNNIIATVGVNRDITERKRAEEELQQSFEKLKRVLEQTVNALASAVETRDPYTAGHQQRVANLACAIAKEIGLSGEQVEGIRMAAIIHDIGKIYIPAEILSKPGRLTEIEFKIIKTHPQIGYDILKTIEFSWPIAQMVHQHHERMDGSGYPQGLSGEEITIEARILAVADVVEAMASHRPYRPAHGIDSALEEISQNRGVLYDPEVVDACLRLFIEKGFKLE
ncbi:MAG: PAS domain S-box protein [Deltaproteobacteria bacterium]|nr:PAS domain S-box protein [Deltaproteobacteria bacterium]